MTQYKRDLAPGSIHAAVERIGYIHSVPKECLQIPRRNGDQ